MSGKLSNAQIAWRAAQDIEDGAYVNLGIGFPELVAKFQPPGRQAIFHTENGVLNFGEAPPEGEEDWDLINAGKKAITLKPGAAFFHHADSFAMVRGGHLDVAILGAYEIAENGDLANWSTGPKGVPAVGGAMDLVHGAKRVAVITDHVTKDGKPKLVKRCSLPLTGIGCVTRVYRGGASPGSRLARDQGNPPDNQGPDRLAQAAGRNPEAKARRRLGGVVQAFVAGTVY
jgi:3-oxoadipate CoA-transferase beta subunit